ncbi:hypothetical protein [Longispora albida]|uniref:hypothetical protein n=1 Tax=Longispora albida TaxID=203523 RepID=UPI0012F87AFE|nr:hypothetical protein [Longispora albida]
MYRSTFRSWRERHLRVGRRVAAARQPFYGGAQIGRAEGVLGEQTGGDAGHVEVTEHDVDLLDRYILRVGDRDDLAAGFEHGAQAEAGDGLPVHQGDSDRGHAFVVAGCGGLRQAAKLFRENVRQAALVLSAGGLAVHPVVQDQEGQTEDPERVLGPERTV